MSYSLGGASGSEPHYANSEIARASEQIRALELEEFNAVFRQIFGPQQIDRAEGASQELSPDRVREIVYHGQGHQGSEPFLEGFLNLPVNQVRDVMRNESRRRFSEGIERWVISVPEETGARQRLANILLRRLDDQNWPENITEIRFSDSISTLPNEIGLLSSLRSLELRNCTVLQSLPDSIGNLRDLRTLVLSGCTSLQTLPDSIGNLEALTRLALFGCVSLEAAPVIRNPRGLGLPAHLEPDREHPPRPQEAMGGYHPIEGYQVTPTPLPGDLRPFDPNAERAPPQAPMGGYHPIEGYPVTPTPLPGDLRPFDPNAERAPPQAPMGGYHPIEGYPVTPTPLPGDLRPFDPNAERAPPQAPMGGYHPIEGYPVTPTPLPGDFRPFEMNAEHAPLPGDIRPFDPNEGRALGPDGTLRVKRTELQNNPRAVLTLLSQALRNLGHNELRVRFWNEPGIDAGGLRKSLWTEIGRNLFSDDPETTTHLYALCESFNPDMPQKTSWMPRLRDGYPEDSKNIEDLGFIMAWGAFRQAPPLLFPAVLDPTLFAVLKARVSGESQIKVLSLLNEGELWRLLLKNPEELEDRDWTLVQENLEALGYETTLLTAGDAPAISDELAVRRRNALDQLTLVVVDSNRSTLDAIDALVRGMESGDPRAHDFLRNPAVNVSEIRKCFLGSIDPETLVASVRCRAQEDLAALQAPSPREQQSLDLLNRYLGWLKAWLRDPVSDQEKQGLSEIAIQELQDTRRRAFLNQVTGKEALVEGEKLFFLGLQPQERPSLHTCYNRLDFPMHHEYTEANFRDDLTALVAVQDQGYNSG